MAQSTVKQSRPPNLSITNDEHTKQKTRISKIYICRKSVLNKNLDRIPLLRCEITLFILTTVLTSAPSNCMNCTKGWFGSKCNFQCHCITENGCDKNGDCADGCASRWFGPQCQYRSSELVVTVNGKPRSELTDNDFSTCIGDGEHSVTIKLQKPHPITWARARIKNKKLTQWLDFEFRGHKKGNALTVCSNPDVFTVDQTTVDVHCIPTYAVEEIHILGMGVSALCSLDVSLGRNVALKQVVYQSSTWGPWKASNAVDGRLGPPDNVSGQADTCSHTYHEDERHWWMVSFSGKVKLTRVDIHNRVNYMSACCEDRLKGFTLTAFLVTTTTFSYTDDEPQAHRVYSVTPEKRLVQPVTEIRIASSEQSDALTLCEVQVFADTLCHKGTFGRECEKKCNCAKDEPCHVSTGECPSGCKPGFMGEECTTVCPDGYYGKNCYHECSKHCVQGQRSCDKVSGACPGGCMPKYKPPLCHNAECHEPNWFGDGCEFQCHCMEGIKGCAILTGDCQPPDRPSNRQGFCARGWFGPGCQYKLAQFKSDKNQPIPSWMADQEDDTCNESEFPAHLKVFLMEPMHVRWIRVVAENASHFQDLHIYFTRENPNADGFSLYYVDCLITDQTATLSNRTIDIQCPSHEMVDTLLILGRGLFGLCGVYISAGRNEALKQKTEMSSTLMDYTADKAVDGTLSQGTNESERLTCAHSKWGKNHSTWTIYFALPVELTAVQLYNQRVCCRYRLQYFQMEAFNAERLVFEYTDNTTGEAPMVFTVVPKLRLWEPITSITITGHSDVFNMCEFMAFGERVCPRGKYGLKCDKTCNCAKHDEHCFVTGGCPGGCRKGFMGPDCWGQCEGGKYGPGCTGVCSMNCAGGKTSCNSADGSCMSGCVEGFKPPECTEKCDVGKYGSNCEYVCGSHCQGGHANCDLVTGHCTKGCEAGYQLPFCWFECMEYYYGPSCLFPCNGTCKDNHCNKIDGSCLECEPGFFGDLCEACPPTLYGEACSHECSEDCLNGTCHDVTGRCHACPVGRKGPYCDKYCGLGLYGEDCSSVCGDHCFGGLQNCDPADGTCIKGCEQGFALPLCKDKGSLFEALTFTTVNNDFADPKFTISFLVVFAVVFVIVAIDRFKLSRQQQAARTTPRDEILGRTSRFTLYDYVANLECEDSSEDATNTATASGDSSKTSTTSDHPLRLIDSDQLQIMLESGPLPPKRPIGVGDESCAKERSEEGERSQKPSFR